MPQVYGRNYEHMTVIRPFLLMARTGVLALGNRIT